MTKLTEQELKLLEEGKNAEEALKNPAIASTLNELSETLANYILNTKPEETDKREIFYNIHSALRELVGILSNRVSIKQQLEAKMAEEEND